MEAFNKFNKIQEAIQTLKDELKAAVPKKDLPQINRLGSGAFTMKLSDLNQGILSPSHYDLVHQAEALEKVIQTSSAEDIEAKLRKILTEGKIIMTKPMYITKPDGKDLKLHPVFIEQCKKAFGL